MIFSMIFEAQLSNPTRERERNVIHECLEQAVLGEAAGFDRVWAVEHHCLEHYAHMSAPEIFLSYVAARTTRIRIGHGVVCVPFKYNHPIRVAERTAMLDILSNGRIDVGMGRGATVQETAAFGIDPSETQAQLEETLRMLPHLWTDESFEWDSDLIKVPPRPILPKPVQSPHPPLFVACTKAPTLSMAGKYGVGALALGFAGPEDIKIKNDIYRAAIASRKPSDVVGHFANDHFSALCPTIVLDDRDEARKIGFRGQRFFVESIDHWARNGPLPTTTEETEDSEDALRAAGAAKAGAPSAQPPATRSSYLGSEKIEVALDVQHASGAHHYNMYQAYGNVNDCIAYVEQLQEAGADEIMFLMQMGTVPHEVIMQSIRNIGEHVLPYFRNKERNSSDRGEDRATSWAS